MAFLKGLGWFLFIIAFGLALLASLGGYHAALFTIILSLIAVLLLKQIFRK